MSKYAIHEAITNEKELFAKLVPLSEVEIFEFMQNLRGGTYFNMGMFSSIPVARAYKKTLRIYKVVSMTAIVSGTDYENIGTTRDFRDSTGKEAGSAFYDHVPGFERKIGQHKKDPSNKYLLWTIKQCSDTWVSYYVVDIATGEVTAVSKQDILESDYLTNTEKNKLMPKKVSGFDLETGALVENETMWRTTKFENIFWLSQAGASTREYGTKFEEALEVTEAADADLFIDAHHGATADLDTILSGGVAEAVEKPLDEAADGDLFQDAHAGMSAKLDNIISRKVMESDKLKESYRRTVSRGASLIDNELFVDFD